MFFFFLLFLVASEWLPNLSPFLPAYAQSSSTRPPTIRGVNLGGWFAVEP
jgi:hypothetical protein